MDHNKHVREQNKSNFDAQLQKEQAKTSEAQHTAIQFQEELELAQQKINGMDLSRDSSDAEFEKKLKDRI